MSPLLCCQTITTTRKMLMIIRTPVTAFQITSFRWQRSVSVKRTRKEKLNLSQPAYIGGRSLPLWFKSINSYKLYTFEKRQLSPLTFVFLAVQDVFQDLSRLTSKDLITSTMATNVFAFFFFFNSPFFVFFFL